MRTRFVVVSALAALGVALVTATAAAQHGPKDRKDDRGRWSASEHGRALGHAKQDDRGDVARDRGPRDDRGDWRARGERVHADHDWDDRGYITYRDRVDYRGYEPRYRPYAYVPVDRALYVTRLSLVHRGFRVIRVDIVDGDRVVYYCRADGYGPVERIVIRPYDEGYHRRVVFEDVPSPVLVDIHVRLGF